MYNLLYMKYILIYYMIYYIIICLLYINYILRNTLSYIIYIIKSESKNLSHTKLAIVYNRKTTSLTR